MGFPIAWDYRQVGGLHGVSSEYTYCMGCPNYHGGSGDHQTIMGVPITTA